MRLTQCLLACGTVQTVAWIAANQAVVDSKVRFREDDRDWLRRLCGSGNYQALDARIPGLTSEQMQET